MVIREDFTVAWRIGVTGSIKVCVRLLCFNAMFKSAFWKRAVIVYPLILAALVGIGLCYSSRAKKQFLSQPFTKMRGLLLTERERTQLRTERNTLSFQFDALPLHFPGLTNYSLMVHWESVAATAVLDPQLCRKWRAYQQRASALIGQKDSQLEF